MCPKKEELFSFLCYKVCILVASAELLSPFDLGDCDWHLLLKRCAVLRDPLVKAPRTPLHYLRAITIVQSDIEILRIIIQAYYGCENFCRELYHYSARCIQMHPQRNIRRNRTARLLRSRANWPGSMAGRIHLTHCRVYSWWSLMAR